MNVRSKSRKKKRLVDAVNIRISSKSSWKLSAYFSKQQRRLSVEAKARNEKGERKGPRQRGSRLWMKRWKGRNVVRQSLREEWRVSFCEIGDGVLLTEKASSLRLCGVKGRRCSHPCGRRVIPTRKTSRVGSTFSKYHGLPRENYRFHLMSFLADRGFIFRSRTRHCAKLRSSYLLFRKRRMLKSLSSLRVFAFFFISVPARLLSARLSLFFRYPRGQI